MEIKSVQKFVRTSPRKLRVVANMIRSLTPEHAVRVLPHVGKRAAGPMLKVVKSAVANARVIGAKTDELTFKEIQIGEGPTLKRGRPVAKGSWHPVLKRMSHIRVVLTTRKSKIQPRSGLPNPKSKTISNAKNKKIRKTKKGGK